ncbi:MULTISPECIES: hypothetical protein [Paenibacillus]|nr:MULTISPECIES: hypothetical protein [Paenibacillus]
MDRAAAVPAVLAEVVQVGPVAAVPADLVAVPAAPVVVKMKAAPPFP